MVAISYYGSEKAVLAYKVMGVAKAALESIVRALAAELGERNVRVNAISAGAMRTLSARGIPGFTQLYRAIPKKTPLRRNIATRDVGDTRGLPRERPRPGRDGGDHPRGRRLPRDQELVPS